MDYLCPPGETQVLARDELYHLSPVVAHFASVCRRETHSFLPLQDRTFREHVLRYDDGVDLEEHMFEGWQLPDSECIYRPRRFGCQIYVSDDMLPTADQIC